MRCVIDCNVIVSALLLAKSKSRLALNKALIESEILLSQSVMQEISEVLRREKFNKYISLEERVAFVGLLLNVSTFVVPRISLHVCRDPNDDKYLELAVSGKADYIISGDKDLLVLHPFQNIQIVTPAQFLRLK